MNHHAPPARRTRSRAFITLVGTLALVMTGLSATTASAAPGAYVAAAGYTHGTGTGYHMGAHRATTGTAAEKAERAYCAIDLDEYGPNLRGSTTYGALKTATQWTARGPGSATKKISGTLRARMAYVLSRWGNTSSNDRAKAIYWLLSDKAGFPRGTHHMTRGQVELAEEMWSAAKREAGNYSLELDWLAQAGGTSGGGVTLPDAPKQLRIKYGVTTGSAATASHLSGVTMELTITGPGTWGTSPSGTVSSNGKKLTITSASKARERVINATGTGKITVTATAKDVYEHRFHYREPAKKEFQRIFIGGKRQTLTRTLTGKIASSFDYAITTTARNTSTGTGEATNNTALKVPAGTLVADRVQVTGDVWPAGAATTLTSTLYGPLSAPPTQQANAPSGTPVHFQSTHPITGRGTYTTTSTRLNAPGWYTYDESTLRIPGFAPAWNGTYGLTRETVLVPWTPSVTTIAHDEETAVGGQAARRTRDEIRVIGGRPNTSLTATAQLYYHGPNAPTQRATVPGGATLVTTQTANIALNNTGAGTGFTPWFTLPVDSAEGFYTWVVTLPATDWSNAYTSPYGVLAETFYLDRFEGQPIIRTLTSDLVAEPGASIHDTLIVLDGNADLEAFPLTVESGLYGPFAEPPSVGANWFMRPDLNDFLVGTVTTSGIDAPGSYDTPSIEVPERGWYVWFWMHYDALGGMSTDGSTEYDAAYDFRVYADEVTVVPWSPQVSTQTSAQRAEPGDLITDTLHLTGARPGHQVTVTSTLYGPLTEVPAPSDTVPAGTSSVGTVTTQVTPGADGAATVETDAIEVATPGVYVWHETIVEDLAQGYYGWSAPFGVASETTVVPWTPQVTTQTSHEVAEPGTELTDHLEVVGLRPGASVDVVSTLYGPFPQRPQLADEVPADAPVAGEVTTTVTGDEDGLASVTTEPVTIEESGYYVWHETIAGTAVEDPWSAPFGVTSETTLVPWSPQVTTQTSEAVVTPGSELFDTLHVTGGRPEVPIAVTSTLYGPFDEAPELGDAVPVDAGEVGVVTTVVIPGPDGTATVDTDPLVVDGVGYYVWHETIDADPQGTWHRWDAPFGVASETTLSQWAPTVVTQTSQAEVEPGALIYDTLIVDGLPEGATVTATTTLYGPFEDAPELSEDVPEGAPVVATVSTEVTGVAPTWVESELTQGVGQYEPTPVEVRTESVQVDEVGVYVWHETIEATEHTQAWSAPFGVTAETTWVMAPADEDEGGSDEDGGGSDEDDGGSDEDGGDDDLPETGVQGIQWLILTALAALVLGLALARVGRTHGPQADL